jgi:hypothetical protein
VQVSQAVHAMCLSLDNMREGCHPFIFYHRVRPFLSAWKHNPTLPDGVIYEGGEMEEIISSLVTFISCCLSSFFFSLTAFPRPPRAPSIILALHPFISLRSLIPSTLFALSSLHLSSLSHPFISLRSLIPSSLFALFVLSPLHLP